MPLNFIEQSPATVSRLAVGETGFITFTEVRVSRDLSTYIDPSAKLRSKVFSTVQVERTERGYRLVLHDPTLTFKPGEITDTSKLIPIEEIVVDVESDPLKKIVRRAADELDKARTKATQRPKEQGAVMPVGRLEPPPRNLTDLALDETGYLAFLDVHVDEDERTYIEKDAALHLKPSPLAVAVTKKTDGYHLTLSEETIRFRAGKIRDFSRLISAVTITENRPKT